MCVNSSDGYQCGCPQGSHKNNEDRCELMMSVAQRVVQTYGRMLLGRIRKCSVAICFCGEDSVWDGISGCMCALGYEEDGDACVTSTSAKGTCTTARKALLV